MLQETDTIQLITLRGAVRLEEAGMKRRGRSASVVAKELLGLPKSAPRRKVLDALTNEIENRKAKLGETP